MENAAATAKSRQLCPTLCNPIDGSPPGSSIPGILQARTLEWLSISFFNAWKWKVKVKSLIRVWLLVIPWTAAYQAPLSMGVSRQEYWSGSPVPSPPIESFWAASFCLVFLGFAPCMCNLPRECWHGMLHLFSFPEFQILKSWLVGCTHQKTFFKELDLVFCLLYSCP